MTERRIVLVLGPPGAGKTTLAVPLARTPGLPLIAKDDIKEALVDVLGDRHGDLAWSRKMGAVVQAPGGHSYSDIAGCERSPHSGMA